MVEAVVWPEASRKSIRATPGAAIPHDGDIWLAAYDPAEGHPPAPDRPTERRDSSVLTDGQASRHGREDGYEK